MPPRPRVEHTRPPKPLLSVEQVADRLQVSTRTVRRWIADGSLSVHRFGRVIRVTEDDLERRLQQARE